MKGKDKIYYNKSIFPSSIYHLSEIRKTNRFLNQPINSCKFKMLDDPSNLGYQKHSLRKLLFYRLSPLSSLQDLVHTYLAFSNQL